MIKKLEHENEEIAGKIRQLFQLAYQVEADLLGIETFPPLQRTISNIKNSPTHFYGYFIENKIMGIIEIEYSKEETEIHSLVVHPDFFRRGIGKKMLGFILKKDSKVYSVQTALKNIPAIKLYESEGFDLQKKWKTTEDLYLIKLIKKS